MCYQLTSGAEGPVTRFSRKPYFLTGIAGGRNCDAVAGEGGGIGGCAGVGTGVAAPTVARPDFAAVLTLRALGGIFPVYAH
jgi:hypothetical protein